MGRRTESITAFSAGVSYVHGSTRSAGGSRTIVPTNKHSAQLCLSDRLTCLVPVRTQRVRQLPVMVVHGGAWAMPDDVVDAHIDGVNKALTEGWRVLESGGRALDAVQAAIAYMED